jgi:hypothetical protein
VDSDQHRLKAFLAHEEIRSCIARVARGEDRRDASLLRASFWPDATCDFGIFAGSFSEYLAWVVPGAAAIIVTQHALGQNHIELQGGVALVETHVTAYHRVNMGTEERDTVIGGRYLDRLEERDGEWRIARRVMLYDWFRDEGVSVDWAQGLMGMNFSAGHFTGRAADDYSVAFFAARDAVS